MSQSKVELRVVEAGAVEVRRGGEAVPLPKNAMIEVSEEEAEQLCRWGVARRADEPAGEKRPGRRIEYACRLPGDA